MSKQNKKDRRNLIRERASMLIKGSHDRQKAAELVKEHKSTALDVAKRSCSSYRQFDFLFIRETAMSILHELACRWNDTTYYRHYNPSRGTSERTWMYGNIQWMLKRALKKEQRKQRGMVQFSTLMPDDEMEAPFVAKRSWIEQLLHNLGADAAEVVKVILFAPAEVARDILPMRQCAKRAQKAVAGHLANKGWTTERFDQAWNEVASAI